MECIYSCEKFNPRNINVNFIIVDETETILSPAYLHTFKDKTSNEKYCVISDNIGIQMPYLKLDNEFVVGTSQYIYFFDVVLKKIERKLLNSPCTMIAISHKRIIVICECDVAIISLADKHVVAEYKFNDIITDYKIHQDCLLIYLMEGTKQKIDI